jgi:hypothetical protein
MKPREIIYVLRSGWNMTTYFMERLALLTERTTLLVLDNVL